MHRVARIHLSLAAVAATLASLAPLLFASGASAEAIKIGLVRSAASAPAYIAEERGYFAAEGVPAEIVYFESSQPIALAVTSHAVDFGITGFTGGFYSLAGQGALKIVAGGFGRDAPGFRNLGYVASNQAYAKGFASLKDFPGHSVAVSQIGSPPHYALGLLMEKYGFDPRTIQIKPVQSIANMASAVAGGQADAAIMPSSAILPLLGRGDAKLLGWIGDETPWEFGAVFTATKTANERRDTVERLLRAWRKATRDCHDQLDGAGGKPLETLDAQEAIAIVSKYTHLSPATIALGMPFYEAEARLDVKNVNHQIAWYKAQELLKGEIKSDDVIDARYVVPLP